MSEIRRIGLLGFGEVGQTLARALLDRNMAVSVYDKQFDNPQSIPSRALREYPTLSGATSPAGMVKSADLVISAVTAAQNFSAAQSVAGDLQTDTWFLDLNSVAPHTKQQVAELIDQHGGRYVEAAVMSPIGPKGIASPILLGGRYGETLLPRITALGFSGARFYSRALGQAAAAKMCRSVMIKGLESLLTEGLLTARHYGVEQDVVASLENLMPGIDWSGHAAYMISRSLIHGERRAEEMWEAARTVEQAGLVPRMAGASAETQAWTAGFGSEAANQPLSDLLDCILAQQRSHRQ